MSNNTKIELTYKGAEALTEMAHKVMKASAEVEHCETDIRNAFARVQGDLGDLQNDADEMLVQATKTTIAVRNAMDGIPQKLIEISNKIIKILDGGLKATP